MTDFIEQPDDKTDAAAAGPRKGFDWIQLTFWAALVVAGGAAGMAITWSEAVGPAGAVLVIALGAMALVLIMWGVRGAGRRLGVFPDRGAAEAAAQTPKRHLWLDALTEPALISDRGGASVAANPAYLELAQLAHVVGDSAHAPSVDRLFSSNPGMAAPIYRLSKAAKMGLARTELLPALLFGDSHAPVQYEASVAPLAKTWSLWRLRRVEGVVPSAGSVDARALYVEDAPIGFFSARRDGRVVYINQTLRQMLGLPDGDSALRLEDIMRPEGLKLMKREVRGQASQRAEVVLRARDGVESTATLITTWAGKGAEAHTRSVVYIASAAEQQVRRAPTPATASGATPADVRDAAIRSDDTMFSDAPFGVVRLDGEGVESAVMLDANRTLVEMTGGRAQPGRRFADLFVADQGTAALADELSKALDGAVNFKLAGEGQKSVDLYVVLDRQGRPSTAYVIDTTEKKLLEQRLARARSCRPSARWPVVSLTSSTTCWPASSSMSTSCRSVTPRAIPPSSSSSRSTSSPRAARSWFAPCWPSRAARSSARKSSTSQTRCRTITRSCATLSTSASSSTWSTAATCRVSRPTRASSKQRSPISAPTRAMR
jgi:two-component system cell cycle sensor histidine kinase/response regulator CckA